MSIDIEFVGMDKLLEKIESMGSAANRIMSNAVKEAAQPILEEAKRLCPVRTGKLRDSLKISGVKSKKGTKYVWVGDVDNQVGYSWFVEYGHSKAKPHPFLHPAYEKKKKEALEIMKNKLIEAIKNDSQ